MRFWRRKKRKKRRAERTGKAADCRHFANARARAIAYAREAHTRADFFPPKNASALGLELEVGDEFYFHRDHKSYGSVWYYSAQSSLITVLSISADGWVSGVAPDFSNSGGGFPAYSAVWAVETAPLKLIVFAKNYPQRSLQVKIKKTVEFFSKVMHGKNPPEIYDRFFPTTKSVIEAPEINASTLPTFLLYQHWINSKKMIEAKPSIVKEIYPGLWMRERYQTEAR